MWLTQWGSALIGCSTLLLTACTVVDLDENGKPILPTDPAAKASFADQTPQQHALDAAALGAQLKTSSSTPRSVFCPPDQSHRTG